MNALLDECVLVTIVYTVIPARYIMQDITGESLEAVVVVVLTNMIGNGMLNVVI